MKPRGGGTGMDVQWHTELSVEKCMERLDEAMDTARWFENLRLRDHEKPVIGRIGDRQFWLVRRPYGGARNSWAPVLTGQIMAEPDDRGSRISGRIGVHEAVRIFMRIWLGFAGVLAVINTIAFVVGAEDVFMLAIPFGLLAFGFGLGRIGTQTGKSEEPFLLDFVRKTLEATEQPPTG